MNVAAILGLGESSTCVQLQCMHGMQKHRSQSACTCHGPRLTGLAGVQGGREDGVGELLHGGYTEEQQQPDADLGRSLREGFRNVLPAAADGRIDAGAGVGGRAFGVPSVRTDLHPPSRASIANAQNFGNEPDAAALLSPCSTADRGVNEEHYSARRSAAGVRGLLAGAGIEMRDGEFEACFEAAAAAEGDSRRASLMSFMDTRHRMLHHQAGL